MTDIRKFIAIVSAAVLIAVASFRDDIALRMGTYGLVLVILVVALVLICALLAILKPIRHEAVSRLAQAEDPEGLQREGER